MEENNSLLTLNEIKEIELNILKYFVDICNRYNLNYSLAYGSLLGAVRHKGFIPWDDDIDVMMPRADFFKLLKIGQELNFEYPIISMYNKKDYFSPLAKMYDNQTILYQHYGQKENYLTGVYIDIFILDGLPTEKQDVYYKKAQDIRKKWGFACRKIFSRHQSRNIFTDIIGSIYSIIYKIKGIKYYRDLYDANSSKYDFYDSDEVAVILFGEGLKKEKIKKKDFLNPILLTFEGYKVKSIRNPEKYLTNMYGDYLKLPPENERISKHPNHVIKKTN